MKAPTRFLLIMAVLLVLSYSAQAQVVLIDSRTVATENSFDSDLGIYTDSLTINSFIDTTKSSESFVMELLCTRSGGGTIQLWSTRLTFVDSAGVMVLHTTAILDLKPGDVNLNGMVSIGDVLALIYALFVTGI